MHDVDLDTRFDLHPATEETGPKMDRMRATLKEAARQVHENTPASREQSTALTKIEEALFWANAAIARSHANKIEHARAVIDERDKAGSDERLVVTPPDASRDDEQQGRSVAELERRGMIEEPVTDEIADASSDFATPV